MCVWEFNEEIMYSGVNIHWSGSDYLMLEIFTPVVFFIVGIDGIYLWLNLLYKH